MVSRYQRDGGLRGAVTRVAPGLRYGHQRLVARTGWQRITVAGLVCATLSMLLADALASSTPVNRMTRMLVMIPAFGDDENSRSSKRQNRGAEMEQKRQIGAGVHKGDPNSSHSRRRGSASCTALATGASHRQERETLSWTQRSLVAAVASPFACVKQRPPFLLANPVHGR